MAVVRARYDERILAMTTRLNLMDWEELRQSRVDESKDNVFTPLPSV